MGQFNDLLVSIGIDTKAAKKEIKKVEGMFDSLVKHVNKPSTSKKKSLAPFDTKKFKAETQEVIKTIKSMGGEVGNLQNKLNSTKSPEGLKTIRKEVDKTFKDLQTFQSATNKEQMSDFRAMEKRKTDIAKQEVKRRQQIQAPQKATLNTVGISNPSGKSAKESALAMEALYKKEAEEAKNLAAIKSQKDRDRYIARQQHRAKLRQQREKDSAKEYSDAQKSLAQRLVIFKQEKRLKEDVSYLKKELSANKVNINNIESLKQRLDKVTTKEQLKLLKKEYQEEIKNAREIADVKRLKEDVSYLKKELSANKVNINNIESLKQRLDKVTTKEQLKLLKKEYQEEIKNAREIADVKQDLEEKRLAKQDLEEKRLAKADKLEERVELSSGFRRLPVQEQKKALQQMAKARESFIKTGDTYEFKKLTSDIREFRRSMVGLQTVQMGLADSTRNMIRSYASLFALVEGTQAIERVGMDFQGMEVAMQAVEGNAKSAQESISFLRSESNRLGFDLVNGAKAYAKLAAAAEGKATKNEIQDTFTSIMEASTVFQLSMDDTIGTIKA